MEFTDANGIKRAVLVNVGAMRRCKKANIDLSSQKTLERLPEDDCLVLDCVFNCLAERPEFQPEDWDRMHNGETVQAALKALLAALEVYFGASGKSEMIKAYRVMIDEKEKALKEQVPAMIEEAVQGMHSQITSSGSSSPEEN